MFYSCHVVIMLLLENWKPSAIGYKQATTVRPLSTAPDDDGGRGKCGQQSIVDCWSRWASCLQRDVRLDLTEAASRGSVSFSWHILLHCVFLFPCYATAKFDWLIDWLIFKKHVTDVHAVMQTDNIKHPKISDEKYPMKKYKHKNN